METYLIAVDISKHNFQLKGVTKSGVSTFEKKLNRAEFPSFIKQQKACIIAMEVGGGAHCWGRIFEGYGHTVKLIPAFYVKPYVKSQKNDRADAEAIAEAALRPSMRFVGVKSAEQQDIQNLHRVRERLVGNETALVNQIRGLLAEYGIILAQGCTRFKKSLASILEEHRESLSALAICTFEELRVELSVLSERIKQVEAQINQIYKTNPICQRLSQVPGVGCITATALIGSAGNPHNFKNGRSFAASLGLVPRQNSTGGKTVLYGITKRGDGYLRKLLIHGARSVIFNLNDKKLDDRSLWLKDIKAKKGTKRAAVALANKNARVIWVLLRNPEALFEKTYKRHTAYLKQIAA